MLRTWFVTSILGALLLAGCQKDSEWKGPEPKGSDSKGSDSKGSKGADSKDLEARVKALEDEAAKNKEALAFLNQVYGQQKAQQEEQEAQEPAPDAIFAVDITGDQIEGPTTAMVTIIEAWDFA